MESETQQLTVTPIGVIRTEMRLKFDAPHQPDGSLKQRNVIELFPGFGYERAVSDLKGFDRVWLIWWFHRNKNWRPMVLPPRGNSLHRKGVFATRAPHRPNPIGLTAVELIDVRGLRVIVGSADLIDGTPILDIKPYLRTVDAFPEAALGWLTPVEESTEGGPRFVVTQSVRVVDQAAWLRERWGIDFLTRALSLLAVDPTPHRTRRITRSKGRYRMGCGAWRLYFSISEQQVCLEEITPGYPMRLLESQSESVPDREAQVAFLERWGEGGEPDYPTLPPDSQDEP